MALLNILQFPDPRLKKVADEVPQINDEVKQLVNDMLETMYEARGIGLAATQVNKHVQVITIDVSNDQSSPLILINPKITATRGQALLDEGCLSFPGIYVKVKRAVEIDVTYLDENGESQTLTTDGLLGHCIQHEIDHLKGITFHDHLSVLKQKLLKKKLDKLRRKTL